MSTIFGVIACLFILAIICWISTIIQIKIEDQREKDEEELRKEDK